jgi:hypothetical protein
VSNYVWDLTTGVGLLTFTAGLWWIYPPLAMIVVGLLTMLFGLWGAKLWSRDRFRPEE